MLRHLVSGYRNFDDLPDVPSVRYNWVIAVSLDSKLGLEFHSALKVESIKNPNFWIIPPHTEYVIRPQAKRCSRLSFHFAYLPEIVEQEVRKRGVLMKRLDADQLKRMRAIAGSVREHFVNPTAISELYFEDAAIQIGMVALEGTKFSPEHPFRSIARERVERAIGWYLEHMHESPSLSDVAGVVHVSGAHLRRHFYEQMGKSPKAVFTRLRMQKAMQILANTSLTLDYVAKQCGFPGATEFLRTFKSIFKVTPNYWRHHVNSSGAVDYALPNEAPVIGEPETWKRRSRKLGVGL